MIRAESIGKEARNMSLNDFKDILFDLINESDALRIAEIRTFDKEDRFEIVSSDGTVIEISCRMI